MNFTRGMIAGLIGAVVGVIVPVLVLGLYLILTWYFNETHGMDRRADMADWQRDGVVPLVGCAIYVGLAAWATYTPQRNFRFAKTLAILFFASLFLYVLVTFFTPAPATRYTYREPPFSEFLMLFLPPVVVAVLLVISRCRNASAIDTQNDSDSDAHSVGI